MRQRDFANEPTALRVPHGDLRDRFSTAQQRVTAHARLIAGRLTEELLTPEERAAGLHFVWETAS
ncbi:hypothetical protein [Streptomyces sp. NPDC127105]|uniref:hypothetical protein n=1 Tax=Streptomyces sp. NPDC127105 TaxID=3345359 RepID=UPI003654E66D